MSKTNKSLSPKKVNLFNLIKGIQKYKVVLQDCLFQASMSPSSMCVILVVNDLSHNFFSGTHEKSIECHNFKHKFTLEERLKRYQSVCTNAGNS